LAKHLAQKHGFNYDKAVDEALDEANQLDYKNVGLVKK
jgi:hypothetical protein